MTPIVAEPTIPFVAERSPAPAAQRDRVVAFAIARRA
jgi:hypothetical protein